MFNLHHLKIIKQNSCKTQSLQDDFYKWLCIFQYNERINIKSRDHHQFKLFWWYLFFMVIYLEINIYNRVVLISSTNIQYVFKSLIHHKIIVLSIFPFKKEKVLLDYTKRKRYFPYTLFLVLKKFSWIYFRWPSLTLKANLHKT